MAAEDQILTDDPVPQLKEEHRTKLDAIVQKMVANGESDDDIKFVVSDFKKKYSGQEPPKKKIDFGGFPDVTKNKEVAPNTLGTPESFAGYFDSIKNEAAKNITKSIEGHGDAMANYAEGMVINEYKPSVTNPKDPTTTLDEAPAKRSIQELSDRFGKLQYEQDKKNNTPSYQEKFDKHMTDVMNDPQLQTALVRTKLKKTNPEEYKTLSSSQAVWELSGKAQTPNEQKQLLESASMVAKGEAEYVNGQFIKPSSFDELFAHSFNASEDAKQIYSDLMNDSPEKVIEKMMARREGRNKFGVIPVPKREIDEAIGGLGGLPVKGIGIGVLAGMVTAALPGGKTIAANVGRAVTTYATSEEMALVGTGGAFDKYFNEIIDKQEREGISDPMKAYNEAYQKAMVTGTADFGMGLIMGGGVGAQAAKTSFRKGALGVLQKYANTAIQETKTGAKLGGLAAGTTLVKSLINDDEKPLSESWSSFKSMMGLHYTMQLGHAALGMGIRALGIPGAIKAKSDAKKVSLALAEQPEQVINHEVGKAVVDGHLKPFDAEKVLSDVAELREGLKRVPKDLTDDATLRVVELNNRIDEKQQKIKDLKDNVSPAFVDSRKEVLEKEIEQHKEEITELSKQKEPKEELIESTTTNEAKTSTVSEDIVKGWKEKLKSKGLKFSPEESFVDYAVSKGYEPKEYDKLPENEKQKIVDGFKNQRSTVSEAVGDVEATAKALEYVAKNNPEKFADFKSAIDEYPDTEGIDISKKEGAKEVSAIIAKEYHNAKVDGSNPELVKAVEQSLKEQPKPNTTVSEGGSVVGGVKQQELDAQKINKEAGVDIYVARQEVDANGSKYTLSQIKENGNTNTFVIEDANGSEIGKAQLSADGNYLENIRIDEKHRRKGLASKVYDFIELRKGIELGPSPNKQSKEAKALWDNRNLKKSVGNKANGGLLAKALAEAMSKTFSDYKNKQQVLLELENKYFEQKGLSKEDFNKLSETEKAEIIKDAVKWKNDNPELVKAVEQSLKEQPAKNEQPKEATKLPNQAEAKSEDVGKVGEVGQPAEKTKKQVDTHEDFEKELSSIFDGTYDKVVENSANKPAKDGTAEDYLSKGKAVLNEMFPNVEVKAYETSAEYEAKEGRPKGSAGMFDPATNRIALNLEAIKAKGVENTIFHEVIHPIVNEVIGKNEEALGKLYDGLESMKNEKGMEAVWEHMNQYFNRGGKIQKVEAVTEFLSLAADGKIDTSKLSKSTVTKIIDWVNKAFEALGIDKRISTADDLKSLSDSVIKALQEGDTSALKETLGKRKESKASEKTIADLEVKRDAEISKLMKPEVKMELVSVDDLINAKDPIAAKEAHTEIKDKYKEIRRLVDCLWAMI